MCSSVVNYIARFLTHCPASQLTRKEHHPMPKGGSVLKTDFARRVKRPGEVRDISVTTRITDVKWKTVMRAKSSVTRPSSSEWFVGNTEVWWRSVYRKLNVNNDPDCTVCGHPVDGTELPDHRRRGSRRDCALPS